MGRKTLFNSIEGLDINFFNEMQRIEVLFSGENVIQVEGRLYYRPDYLSIETYIDYLGLIKHWKYSATFITTNDLRESLKITKRDFEDDDLTTMLIYFEYVLNISYFALDNSSYPQNNQIKKQLNIIINNMNYILQRLNYKLQKINDRYEIIENDINTTAVAEEYDEIAHEVIEYRKVLLKGNLDTKRKILNALANQYESFSNKIKSNNQGLYNDIQYLINKIHIRHNNEDIFEKINSEELEKWYDRTYNLLLTAFLINKNIEFKSELKELKLKL